MMSRRALAGLPASSGFLNNVRGPQYIWTLGLEPGASNLVLIHSQLMKQQAYSCCVSRVEDSIGRHLLDIDLDGWPPGMYRVSVLTPLYWWQMHVQCTSQIDGQEGQKRVFSFHLKLAFADNICAAPIEKALRCLSYPKSVAIIGKRQGCTPCLESIDYLQRTEHIRLICIPILEDERILLGYSIHPNADWLISLADSSEHSLVCHDAQLQARASGSNTTFIWGLDRT